MSLEKVIRVRIVEGKLWISDLEEAKGLSGFHYIVAEETFDRLVQGVYDAAHRRDDDNFITIDDDTVDLLTPSIHPEGDPNVYHITNRCVYIRGQMVMLRYITPETELEEVIDEQKSVGGD